MLTLLLGTDWTANRQQILSMLADDVASERAGRILIVPELISHDTERRLCAAAGDTCSRFAEVLSFSRLVGRVSDYVGQVPCPCLDNGGRVVAMAAAVRQLHSRLKAYASVETRPEFLESLVDAVDEFKRCCISANDLMIASRETTGALAQKLEELSLILESYDGICQNGKRDPRDQMTLILEELEDSTFGQTHTFYIDGFPDFTRQHMAILKHLILTSDHVTVSVTCDQISSGSMAFEKAGQTAFELTQFAKEHGVELRVCQVSQRNDCLRDVRKLLFQGTLQSGIAKDVLQVYHAESIHKECNVVAEKILALVQNGTRFRDINIACPDIHTYRSTVEMIFRRCRIPLYISGTEDILERNLMTTVLAAMDAALGGFEQDDVLQYLKSALSPLSDEQCDRVENYVLLWGISGSAWKKAWQFHPDGLGCEPTDASTSRLGELNHAREVAIEPLVHLCDGFKDAQNVAGQVEAIYAFLNEISLNSRLSRLAEDMDRHGDNRSAQILNQLWEILLTALEQLYDTLGTVSWDNDTFTRLFKVLLHQYDVGTIPPVLDAVTMGPISAMRCQQVKHLIVMGALEGDLPKYSGTTGVLTDQERTALRLVGVPLTGGSLDGLQAELAEIYGVFCGAEDTITVTCPDGQTAVVYRRLAEMAGCESNADGILAAALCDRVEAGAYLVRHDDADAAEALGLADAFSQVDQKVRHALGSVEKENIQKLYGTVLNLSASQVDRQAQCRLSYFLRYGLRAKERKPATVDSAEFGTYVHAVLENTVRDVTSRGGFSKVSLADTLDIANMYSRQYAEERFSELDSRRLNYLFKRNTDELALIVRELWDELSQSDFEPVGFEVGFGEGMDVPPIDVSGQQLPARLRGFVDRVDAWKNGDKTYFRVVDYKTGRKDFDYCDLYNGYGLQMLLYLFALENGGESLLGDHAIPAGVQYFPARVPMISADGRLSDEDATEARSKVWKRRGLLLHDEDVLHAMEKADPPVRLPYSVKKDGSVSGDLADRKRFAILKSYVFGVVSRMVDDIASGDVSANPYSRGVSHDACAYCPYDPVCHKQDVTQRRNFKATTAEKFWADLELEVKKNG